nr:mas-related G-protein coupled receptor member X1-like [Microcebus murinus]
MDQIIPALETELLPTDGREKNPPLAYDVVTLILNLLDKGTGSEFLSMESTPPAWSTEFTAGETHYETYSGPCELATRILAWLTALIAPVGLVGNGIVLWLLGVRMRRNAFSVYILNLAVADFIYLCFLMIESMYILINLVWYPLIIYMIFIYVLVFSYLAGLSMLSAISTERCMSVLWPIWYRCCRSRDTSTVVCGLLWAMALLVSTVNLFCGFLYGFDHDVCQTAQITGATWLTVLFVVLCGSSLTLLLRFLCGSRPMRMTRLYVTILLTVLVFLLCALPLGIAWLSWIQGDFEVDCYLRAASLFLSSVNSSANPIIYFFVGSFRQRRQQGRQTLRQVLQRALQDTPEVDEPGGSLPQGSLELSGSR